MHETCPSFQVTRPSAAMLQAMLAAPVGDDVWGDDPTVNRLQGVAATMFGKEAAIFCPSGTMTNQSKRDASLARHAWLHGPTNRTITSECMIEVDIAMSNKRRNGSLHGMDWGL